MSDAPPPVPGQRLFPLFRLVFGFAAAFFVGALATDIVYSQVALMQWSNFSMWLLTAGLVVALVAAVVGLVELLVDRPQGWFRTGWALPVGAAVASVVEVFNAFVHSRDAWESVMPTGLTLSVIAVVILLLIPVFERSPRAAERFA